MFLLFVAQSKALRERWLLDGVPSGGLEHEEVKRQLQQDEERTRALEDTIGRSELKQSPNAAPEPPAQAQALSWRERRHSKDKTNRSLFMSIISLSVEVLG